MKSRLKTTLRCHLRGTEVIVFPWHQLQFCDSVLQPLYSKRNIYYRAEGGRWHSKKKNLNFWHNKVIKLQKKKMWCALSISSWELGCWRSWIQPAQKKTYWFGWDDPGTTTQLTGFLDACGAMVIVNISSFMSQIAKYKSIESIRVVWSWLVRF